MSEFKVVYVGTSKAWDFAFLSEHLSLMNRMQIGWEVCADFDQAMQYFFDQTPIILLVVEEDVDNYQGMIAEIKNDEVFMYLPILLLARKVDSDLRKIAFSLGIEHFLEYGADQDEFLLTVHSAVRNKIKLDTVMEKLRQVSEENIARAIQLDILRNYVPLSIWYRSEYLAEVQSYKIPEDEIELTVFFADLQGFSTRSEAMKPKEVVGMLNAIFDVAVRAIDEFGGDVDKFIGDAILAVFANPRNALGAGLKIQRSLPADGPQLRIGIHYGPVIRGSVGGGNRWDYTLISDVVNTAQRLESQAPPGTILISREALEKANLLHKLKLPFQEYTLKGKKNTIQAAILKPKVRARTPS